MLAVLGFSTLVTFMVLVLRRYATAFVAIISVPILFALIAGRGADLPEMMLSGIEVVAPTAVLLLFAVLYFGLMMDAKLFDPLTNFIIRVSKGDPVKIAMGTAVLALTIALDGDGTTSYMIICAAFIPLYQRLKMNPLIIAVLATLALGLVSGSTPWGGAATRAISVMGLDASDYFNHMIPSLVLTGLFIVGIGFYLGLRERKRVDPADILALAAEIEERRRLPTERPTWRFWFNLTLTLALLVLLMLDIAPLVILFMVGFVIALVVNHPRLADQGELIKTHASNAVPVVMLVLAAGIFTGILTESGMITAMADTMLSAVPESLGTAIPLITAFLAIPLGFFMSNDAFFFGILPVLAESASHYGVHANEIARAGVIGQMAHMIGPASAPLWVLLGLLKADLAEFQKFAIKWVLLASLVFIVFAVLTGAISAPF